MITYALLDIRRLLRNTGGTIFTVLMPAGFYLIFGATQSYTDAAVAHGNVKATIMVSMAVYGAVLAVTTWGSHAALEQQRGWGRQLALTPMTPLKYVFSKVLAIETVALVPLAVVFRHGCHHQCPRRWVALVVVLPAVLGVLDALHFVRSGRRLAGAWRGCDWDHLLLYRCRGLSRQYVHPAEWIHAQAVTIHPNVWARPADADAAHRAADGDDAWRDRRAGVVSCRQYHRLDDNHGDRGSAGG